MSRNRTMWRPMALLSLVLALAWMSAAYVFAEGASGDNSLSTLGIVTEGVTVSPEFYYSTIEYNVTVPAGTTQLELNPVTSNENARIVDITGTAIENGETTVVITVEAENGNQYSYYLYVTTEEGVQEVSPVTEAPETEPPTEAQTETEPETEDPRYVKVDRTALEEANNTISSLKAETSSYRDRVNLLMKILYALIGFCVVLLFAIINLVLKKKDLKTELSAYRGLGYGEGAESLQETQYIPEEEAGGGYGDAPSRDSQAGYRSGGNQKAAPGESRRGGRRRDRKAPKMQPFVEEDYREEEYQEPAKQKGEDRKPKDDPASVPKPEQAKKQPKRMPQYEEPPRQPRGYQPPPEKPLEGVEIDLIDL